MIIAISGHKNVGKDLVGKIIQWFTKEEKLWYDGKPIKNIKEFLKLPNNFWEYNSQNPTWEIKKFADKLKDIVCILLNCTREQLEDEEFKNKELGKEWRGAKIRNLATQETWIINETDHYDIDQYLKSCKTKCIFDGNINLTPRLLLQLLGTECGRKILHPNIWVNSLMSEYDPANESKWIITDMRFTNEFKAVKDRNVLCIRINRDTGIIDTHESETALDNETNWDYVIDNNGTLEELIESLKYILTKEKII